MALVKCRTCHGEYETIQADGLEYYHACPLLSPLELAQGLTDGTVTLTPREWRALQAAVDVDEKRLPTAEGPTAVERFFQSIVKPRPNARDENIVVDSETGKRRPKAIGLGVDELVP